ncbi:MAG: ribonuclease HII [Bacteroidia bacterium]
MTLKKFYQTEFLEAGCDEAGRGCLAGPVFAAAVILDENKTIKGLDDSKKLTEKSRVKLRREIEEKAYAWAVAYCTPQEIDEINILQASFKAMHKALNALSVQPQLLLIDGNRFKPYNNIKHICMVKGDGKYQSIAAASILAKTHRDEYMLNAHLQYTNYGWNQNKGYPTKAHREAIKTFGITELHRKSFALTETQLKLF